MLTVPMDVEDLGKLGRRKGACPYYAARAALPEADLVLLPYAALLLQVGNLLGAWSLHVCAVQRILLCPRLLCCGLLYITKHATKLPSHHRMLSDPHQLS